MYGYLLQDWLTIRGTQSGASVTQSEMDWLSFQPYQDIIMWLEVKSVALGGLTSLTLEYQTAPAKDESLFRSMTSSAITLAAATTPTVTPIILAQNPYTPLARWVRWKLFPNGTPSGEYGACFRIHCAANAVSAL